MSQDVKRSTFEQIFNKSPRRQLVVTVLIIASVPAEILRLLFGTLNDIIAIRLASADRDDPTPALPLPIRRSM